MARSIEARIEALEAELPLADEKYPVMIVVCQPWCRVGLHSLPHGYLRGYSVYGYGLVTRKSGESEEEVKARAIEIARERRGPRCGIILLEDREMVKCTERHDVATV